eukprot:3178622-Prymnesium_polylepis.2
MQPMNSSPTLNSGQHICNISSCVHDGIKRPYPKCALAKLTNPVASMKGTSSMKESCNRIACGTPSGRELSTVSVHPRSRSSISSAGGQRRCSHCTMRHSSALGASCNSPRKQSPPRLCGLFCSAIVSRTLPRSAFANTPRHSRAESDRTSRPIGESSGAVGAISVGPVRNAFRAHRLTDLNKLLRSALRRGAVANSRSKVGSSSCGAKPRRGAASMKSYVRERHAAREAWSRW